MKTFYDLKPGDKVRAVEDFFNDFSYGKTQRLTAGKEYEVVKIQLIEYDYTNPYVLVPQLNIICDAGHSCYWPEPHEQFEVVQ